MSFSAQWFSKSISKDNIDNNDINGKSGISVNSVNIVSRGEILQWGDHAHLVEWFFSAKDSLPRERFTYDQGEGWQVIWMTPAASYENLAAEIEKGPGGQWDAEVRSILEQLHKLFGNKVYAINEYKENEQ
jgi:hypothetical protein